MTGGLRISLPLPPGVNSQYATVNGRRVLSAEARRWKALVSEQMSDMRFSGALPEVIISTLRSGYLSLFIDFYFATPMKRDLDGGLKISAGRYLREPGYQRQPRGGHPPCEAD